MKSFASPPTPLVPQQHQRPPQTVTQSSPLIYFRGLKLAYLLVRQSLAAVAYWFSGRLTDSRKGQLLVETLERMGFLWVKIGEMMAKRTDLYSDDFCREFAQIGSRHRGFSFELVKQTLQEEFGRPLETVFQELDPVPFHAITIAQVHRAVLFGSHDTVAVKVQLPDIQAMFDRDLRLIRSLVAIFKWLGIQKNLRWDSILWELNQAAMTDVDYRYEAANLRRMRKTLRPQKIAVPKVYDSLSTRCVLVTEYMEGESMTQVIEVAERNPQLLPAWLEENNIDLRRVGRRLFVFFLRQLMEENVMPGDLSPRHILLLRDSRLALVGFGLVTTVESDFLNKYVHCIRALSQAQYGKAADLVLLLCPDLPVVDLPAVRSQMVHCFRAWAARAELRRMPYEEKSLASMFRELSRILAVRNIVPGPTFMNLNHIWGMLDQSLSCLIPDANYNKLFHRYFDDASRRSLRSAFSGRSVMTAISGAKQSLSEYQQIAGTALRRSALVFQGGKTKLSDAVATMLKLARFGLLGCIVLFTLNLLQMQFDHGLDWLPFSERLVKLAMILPKADHDLLVILLAISIYGYWTLGRLKHRFNQRDVLLPGHARGIN